MAAQLLDDTLGNLACNLPGATRVFHEFHLDFCCGGAKSLRQAARERGIDAGEVAARLLALDPQDAGEETWREAAPAQLIDHVLTRYHAIHRQQLPELIRLAARVEQVHGRREECPNGLTELLMEMQQELESHMQKEEQVLFPMILRGAGAMAGGPISVMRFEHDQHGEALERLAELTDDIRAPAGACNTWQALYRGLNELRVDLMQHIHLENNLLFPRALGMEVSHG
ncbi:MULTISPECIES: iron-sulfur cluster repair protein YtfE [unclassified Pseudomonas]|uniref:iron-sulfur cluster repair protein YtfE n=1 Tax=unclassified Pseudomonas TaxID=196821 RepID=UPI002446DCEF|nr:MULTISPECIES: iron-sulfur cluster repair protein YtfE [unclassified Pseudomonas]MDG9926812.1 iron-sulfur cluster repair protein YtfE [Pseudomonas sp. GD04042]MDH0484382.1 iron-sulfur cluster repair protein YtfE [Pseudomonas sp. GD04015]MDH0606594.1 iron-sulfur cluster repair protein YtfE [Pseudomonas sp. GD03869]